MTITLDRATSAPGSGASPAFGPNPTTPPPARDRSIDTVRAALLVVVVVLHSMMVGVSIGPAGPVLENALEGQAWFAPVSWVVQIMPLFFIVGGFASITQWRRLRGSTSAAGYVRGRIDRLVRPAIALVAVIGTALFGMTLLGVPADIVAIASFRIGQPMWFLGVYILCSALVPVMVRAHERARVLTPVLLLAAVIAVDTARLATGIDAIGFLNLLFVWLVVQQLGFWLADGHIDALPARTRVAILGGAFATLLALTMGPYPADMLVNLNPPTLCLVVLGVAQLMGFSLLRPRIAALAERPLVRRVTDLLGQRSMTVYLWHMPVLIALAAVLLLLNAAGSGGATGIDGGIALLPDPLSPDWWASRPLWLVAVAVAVVPVARLFGRFERGRRMTRPAATAAVHAITPTPLTITLDVLLGAGGVAVALIAGFGIVPAVVSLTMLGGSLMGSGRVIHWSTRVARRLARAAHPSRTSTPNLTESSHSWN